MFCLELKIRQLFNCLKIKMHLLIGIHVFHYFCHQKIKLQDKPNEHTLLWLFEYQFHLINNDLVAS